GLCSAGLRSPRSGRPARALFASSAESCSGPDLSLGFDDFFRLRPRPCLVFGRSVSGAGGHFPGAGRAHRLPGSCIHLHLSARSGSRGGYLSGAAGLVVAGVLSVAVLRRAGSTIFWRTALGGAALGAVFLAALFVGFNKSELLSGRARSVIDPNNIRIDLWKA